MRKRPMAASEAFGRACLPGLLVALATALAAQTLPPGQLPPGPPPQPGQVGPAPEKLPANAPEPPRRSDEPRARPEPIAGATPDTIRTSVQYVLVPTTVLDPDGHGYVNGLEAKDFEVYDNSKLQHVTAEYTQLPLSVVLVVQANSEVEPLLPEIKRSGLLLQGLVTGQDGDVAVLAFDHRMQHLQDFTTDPDKLDDAMHKITAGSSSAALVDAVIDADAMLRHHDPQNVRRRVIILMSRNIDKGSESHLEETVRKMQFDNVIVYAVDISKAVTAALKKPDYPRPQNGGVPPEALPNARGSGGALNETNVVQQETGNILNGAPPLLRSMRDLFRRTPAEAFSYFTGGRVYSFHNENGLEAAITDIGKDLNSQYLLSYNPNDKDEPGFHTIKVVVNRPGLVIRTRPGYWWAGGQQ
jgi:VWFA-related protein